MSNLINTITKLNDNYMDHKDEIQKQRQVELEEKRKQARDEAMQAIIKDCDAKLKTAATTPGRKDEPKKEARIFEWKFSENLQFNGCYLRDLLNKGDLLEEIQVWFDQNHAGSENERVFKVYYTLVGHPRNEDRKYALFVSWDQADWNRIDDLLNRTKFRFKNPRPSQNAPRSGFERGGYRGRAQRGGRFVSRGSNGNTYGNAYGNANGNGNGNGNGYVNGYGNGNTNGYGNGNTYDNGNTDNRN